MNPGTAIKKPILADVPTARWIFFPKTVNVGTLKLPPPIPINTEKKPIIKLIVLFNKKFFGRLFAKIILKFKNILIATKLAIKTKIITNKFPFIELAKNAPKIEPKTTPIYHFFKTSISIFPNL